MLNFYSFIFINISYISYIFLYILPIVEFSTTRLLRGCFLNNSASICVGSHAL